MARGGCGAGMLAAAGGQLVSQVKVGRGVRQTRGSLLLLQGLLMLLIRIHLVRVRQVDLL